MIAIREVDKNDIELVSKFLATTMEGLFPFPLTERSKKDLTEMEERFIKKKDATMIAAFLNKEVVGTIAITRYDNRIVSIADRYDIQTTCEVIKCYVDKNKRQQGIGSLLFNEAVNFAKQANYVTMYLHTHRFLPGGLPFWLKKDFSIFLDEPSLLETVHMEKKI